jgi:hypothetical protein
MKSQGWLRDVLVAVVGGVLILIATEMRADFKDLVKSVNGLSSDVRLLTAQVTDEHDAVKDHEERIRKLEDDHHTRKIPNQ